MLVLYTEDRSNWFGEWKEWKGYAYSGSMFVTAVIQSLALHQYFHIMMTIGMRTRTAVIGHLTSWLLDQLESNYVGWANNEKLVHANFDQCKSPLDGKLQIITWDSDEGLMDHDMVRGRRKGLTETFDCCCLHHLRLTAC